jgi:hypothetical protein
VDVTRILNLPTVVQTDLVPTASNSPAGSSTADIPLGSFVLVAVNIGNNVNSQINSVVDSTNQNVYTLVQPTANAGTTSNCFAYCLSTTADIPIGSSWTTTTAGSVFWNMKRVLYCQNILALDSSQTLAQPTPATSASLSIVPAKNYEISFGYVYPLGTGAGGGTIVTPAGWVNILNNSYNDFSYRIQTGGLTTFVYNPTWSSSSAYDIMLLNFSVTADLLPTIWM